MNSGDRGFLGSCDSLSDTSTCVTCVLWIVLPVALAFFFLQFCSVLDGCNFASIITDLPFRFACKHDQLLVQSGQLYASVVLQKHRCTAAADPGQHY